MKMAEKSDFKKNPIFLNPEGMTMSFFYSDILDK